MPWIVAGITLLALALRLYRLDAQSLWVDEMVTYLGAKLPITDLLLTRNHYAMAHPLYFAAVRLVFPLGMGEAVLRLPSAIFGTLTVPLVYLAGRRWLGERVGVAATVLVALSPFHLYYSQEARPYAMLLFFALLTVVCLQRLLAEPTHVEWRAGFVLSAAGSLYCHPTALAFLAVVVLHVIFAVPRGDRRPWVGTFVAVLILMVPVLIALAALPPVRAANPAEPVTPFAIPYTMWAFAAGYSLGPSVRELHAPDRVQVALESASLVVPIMLLFSGLSASGMIRAWRVDRTIGWTLVAWLVLPVALVVVGSLVTHHPYNVRYAILAFLPFALVVAGGVAGLRPRLLGIFAWGILLTVSAAALRGYYFDPRFQRDDYRSAVRALVTEAGPGDLVLVSPPYTRIMLRYYDPGPVEVVEFPLRGSRLSSQWADPERLRSELDRLTAGRERMWLLLSRTFHGVSERRLRAALDRRFRGRSIGSWPGTELVLYEARHPASAPGRSGATVLRSSMRQAPDDSAPDR